MTLVKLFLVQMVWFIISSPNNGALRLHCSTFTNASHLLWLLHILSLQIFAMHKVVVKD